MPIYIYKHPEKDEYEEVVQTMREKHEYFDKDGLEWKRVFVNPNMSINTRVDPHSKEQFVRATDNKNYTMGDMWDKSAELSEKRAEKDGKEDPVKRKFFDDYKKARKGSKHPADKPKSFENKDVKVEF